MDSGIPKSDKSTRATVNALWQDLQGVAKASELTMTGKLETTIGTTSARESAAYAKRESAAALKDSKSWITLTALDKPVKAEAAGKSSAEHWIGMTVAEMIMWFQLHRTSDVAMTAQQSTPGGEWVPYYTSSYSAEMLQNGQGKIKLNATMKLSSALEFVKGYTDASDAMKKAAATKDAKAGHRLLTKAAEGFNLAGWAKANKLADRKLPGHPDPVAEGIAKSGKRYTKLRTRVTRLAAAQHTKLKPLAAQPWLTVVDGKPQRIPAPPTTRPRPKAKP
jgi:hypothetical protein